jgi:DNA transposition AAA+ family ATPase
VIRHHLGLRDAEVLATRHLLLTGQALSDLLASEAMGAIVGPAGVGKTFAIEHALERCRDPVIRLTFEARPTMRLVADRLLHALTGAPGSGTRFAMTDELLNRLAERRRLVVIGEAQNLNRDCFEYLRHLHDEPATHFVLIFDGGDGCWEVLAREPMLRSRIYRRVAFAPLSEHDVIALIPGYHPIYANADPQLLRFIDDKAANGRLRSWAAFTHTAAKICHSRGRARVDRHIAASALTQLGGAG